MNPGFSPRRWAWLALAAACLPFLAGLPGGFVLDDYPVLLQSQAVRMESFSLSGLWQAAFAYDPQGGLPRPLANASFALNHLVGGIDPVGYKLVNLALHFATALLAWRLALRLLLACGQPAASARYLGLVVAVLWAVHPLQVSTVLYVVQRMEILCTLFTLLSALAFVQARQRQIAGLGGSGWLLAGSAAAALLAWTTKENAALIPYFLLAIELLVFRGQAARPALARTWQVLGRVGLGLGLLAAIALYAYGLLHPELFSGRDFGPLQRLAAQAVVLPHYLGLILLPRPEAMVFYYDQLWLAQWPWWQVAAGAGLLSALAAAVWLLRRRRPLVALGIAWFLLGHLITSAPLPLEIAFEHRNYTPLFGVLLALAGLWPTRPVALRPALLAMAGVLVLALAGLTTLRAAYWSDPFLLAHYHTLINPQSARAAVAMGDRYALAANRDPQSPFVARAIAEYERAMQLPQGSITGEHALVLMAKQFGMATDPRWWASIERKLQEQPLRPQDMDSLLNLVEHRLDGLALDDIALLRNTLIVARRQPLAPELLLEFASHAAMVPGQRAALVELLARALRAAQADPEFAGRIEQGIRELGGATLLAEVQAWTAPGSSTQPARSPHE